MTGQSSGARVRAPEFPGGLEWVNTARPLRLADLQGKIVLLHFWSYGCIRCLHTLAELDRIEGKYPSELLVVGVHRGRFERERETESIRQAVHRHGIRHAVVNDPDCRIGELYSVREWPCLCLIDPQGIIELQGCGVRRVDIYDRAISDLIRQFERKGRLNRRPVPGIGADAESPSGPGLWFPGNLLADTSRNRLFISDTGRHRVLEIDLATGQLQRVVGAGLVGLIDGGFDRARFHSPQGLAGRGDLLLVADTGNHVVREVDLARETVRTIAGTGQPSRELGSLGSRSPGRRTSLSSPWDLVWVGETLYVTMAGCDQIWRIDLETDEVSLHAGSGARGFRDGPHATAELAQPTGITSDGVRLYFTDSESSSIRTAGRGSDGEVTTLIGAGLPERPPGEGSDGLLRHPRGVIRHRGTLYIADTYNGAVRCLDLETGRVSTLGQPGSLGEPGGATAAGDLLLVADTNHHRIMRFDLKTGAMAPWEFTLPRQEERKSLGDRDRFSEIPPEESDQLLPPICLGPGPAKILLELELPENFRLNRTAPFEISAWAEGPGMEIPGGSFQLRTGDPVFPIAVPLRLRPGGGILRGSVVAYFCQEPDETLCFYRSRKVGLPVQVEEGMPPEARILLRLDVPSTPI